VRFVSPADDAGFVRRAEQAIAARRSFTQHRGHETMLDAPPRLRLRGFGASGSGAALGIVAAIGLLLYLAVMKE